ncbi:hypothetical protein RvY_10442 [Ramazzottius varieornatus]|uniref:Uncharacterized protein n=1 Tax=Ramazzottius varieornatus TaxID=947166 RepID=A0A1D1VI45_RAMVA|nr:hypothetical protein RvY_10442 [Ramazzottius varieornatus]
MARNDRFLEFLFAFAILCCMQVQVSPRPNPTSPDFNFVLHEEYLAFGEWVGGEDFPIENMSSVLVNKQLQLRCFQELRNQRSPLRYLLNDTESFYVSTVEKFDAMYGTWMIRAKLPSKVQGTMKMTLTNANCRPPSCPPMVAPPATLLTLKP